MSTRLKFRGPMSIFSYPLLFNPCIYILNIVVIFFKYDRISTYNVHFIMIAFIIKLRHELIFGVNMV